MTETRLEHVHITVRDPHATARWMHEIFGWRIRWEGPVANGGLTVHVGGADSYLALFRPAESQEPGPAARYRQTGGLNHVAVVVDDLDAVEERVRARGFEPGGHADYAPGRRFYFFDDDGIEYEVVSYA